MKLRDRYKDHFANIKMIEGMSAVSTNPKRIEGVKIYFDDASGEDKETYYDLEEHTVNTDGMCSKIDDSYVRTQMILMYGLWARTVVGDLN